MQLPEEFIKLMQESYSAQMTENLCSALAETEPEVSVRLNTRKYAMTPPDGLEPVPWCPDAYYLNGRPPFTFDPLLHAGAYYVQEAGSMYISQFTAHSSQFIADKPCLALDLCAAPGGKSTLLAGLLPKGSLLISNEPIPKRAQVLRENMQKWTMPGIGLNEYPVRSIVTNNYPADFGAFTNCFDLILTDVPCSGEGMFRKDEQAVKDWSMENVMMCQKRQRSILQDIWHALRPGGLLIYSTCTFNHYEDEDNVRWICSELGGELLEERHFLPGRDRGEGFYCAAIEKKPHPLTPLQGEGSGYDSNQISVDEVATKAKRTLKVMPEAFELEGPRVELSYDEALQYLRHEAVRVEAPRGMVTLCYHGLPLGPGKCVGNRINNLYPEQWRIRSTYTQKWSLEEL